MTGEFFLVGEAREYYDGHVISSDIYSETIFEFPDLYRWTEMTNDEDLAAEDITGQKINGEMSDDSIQLVWPKCTPKSVFSLAPRLSYLGSTSYRKAFKSGEFIGHISRLNVPLVDGQVVTGGVLDWLKYKITYTRIK